MLQTDIKGPLTLAGIVVGLSLLLGLGGSYLLDSWLDKEVAGVVSERVASARATTLGPRIGALKAQERAAAAYSRVISLLLPTQEQLLEVPRTVEQLGVGHGVDARFQFQGSPPPGNVEPGASLPFMLSANGSPSGLADFLADFERKNPRYTLALDTTEITASTLESGGGKLTVSGSFYYQ